jgi:hypothetical protein
VNSFFVSFGALLPGSTNLGPFVVALGAISMWMTLSLTIDALHLRERWQVRLRRLPLLVISLGVYAYQCWQGVALLHHADDSGARQTIALLVVYIYGLGVVRAWVLLGSQRMGVLSRLVHWDVSPAPSEAADKPEPQR